LENGGKRDLPSFGKHGSKIERGKPTKQHVKKDLKNRQSTRQKAAVTIEEQTEKKRGLVQHTSKKKGNIKAGRFLIRGRSLSRRIARVQAKRKEESSGRGAHEGGKRRDVIR